MPLPCSAFVFYTETWQLYGGCEEGAETTWTGAVDTWVLSTEGKAAEKPDPGPTRALKRALPRPEGATGMPEFGRH